MDDRCSTCGYVYKKRRRCYRCNPGGIPRSGQMCECKTCGKEFYAAKWQLEDVQRNSGTYCSLACKYKGLEIDGPGARRERWDGYIEVYYPKHPMSTQRGWILEHRLVAAEALGRLLDPSEHVHHINGDRRDNRPENLQAVGASEHQAITLRAALKKRAAERQELQELRALAARYAAQYGPLDKE